MHTISSVIFALFLQEDGIKTTISKWSAMDNALCEIMALVDSHISDITV